MVTENKFRPLKKVVIAKRPYIRPALFYTSAESFARSGVFFKPRAESDAVPGVISEAIIGMVTTLRESENDVQATKHEYESDLEKVETTRQLHAQNDALYRKNVIPKQTFEESFTALKKAVDKAEGAKARWMEYEAEVAINRWRLAQAKGETVTLVDKAKSHLRLWEARLAKVKAAENEAKAGFDYALLSYDIVKALEKTHAASRADVISAQRDWEEGVVLLKLAKKLVDRNTAHVEEAKDAVKQAERASSVGM